MLGVVLVCCIHLWHWQITYHPPEQHQTIHSSSLRMPLLLLEVAVTHCSCDCACIFQSWGRGPGGSRRLRLSGSCCCSWTVIWPVACQHAASRRRLPAGTASGFQPPGQHQTVIGGAVSPPHPPVHLPECCACCVVLTGVSVSLLAFSLHLFTAMHDCLLLLLSSSARTLSTPPPHTHTPIPPPPKTQATVRA